MRDLAFIRGDIRDLSSVKPGAASGNFNGVGMWDSQGEQTGIRDFN